MNFQLMSFKANTKEGPLLGTCSIKLVDKKITMHNCKVFKANAGHKFIKLPDVVYEKNGEKKYFTLIQFDDKEELKAMETAILKQLETYKPVETIAQTQDVPF